MRPLVYLAGPISGLSYDGASDWRIGVRRALLPDVESLNPMRDKEMLHGEAYLGEGYIDTFCSEATITSRDSFDIERSTLLLVNMLGATKASQGTLWELGYASALGKRCIIVMEPSGNPMDTFFVRASASVRVDNLPEAVEVVRSFLLPG